MYQLKPNLRLPDVTSHQATLTVNADSHSALHSVKSACCALLVATSLMMVAPVLANTELIDSEKYGTLTDTDSTGEFHSAWITTNGLSANTDVLINAVNASMSHGLNPESYKISSVEQAVNTFVTNSEKSGVYISTANAQDRNSIETKLDRLFITFVTHLGQGVLDAQKTQRDLHRAAPDIDTNALLEMLHEGQISMHNVLAQLTQQTPAYKKLQAHLLALLDERAKGTTRTKVLYRESVKPGGQYKEILDVRKRLMETGDLPENSRLSLIYDSTIENALKQVQARHGLTENGELTDDTVLALNATVDDDIAEVAMNLERWRWMPRDLGERHILVNIPAYKLTMQNGDQKIADMAVVVGSKKHPTPAFSKGARFVEVAPTWTVPASITNNELIPLELKKPGYLERERFDFFQWQGDRLKKVPRSQVTQADFHKKPFPYVLRQRSGEGNALGKLKILMPNKHAVYMHDTQAKSLFAKTDRAYSHGCIRLSDPFRLGSLLLQLDGKTQQETQDLLKKEETTRVKLQHRTPTHISYFTAWIDDEGKLNKRKDVYKHNKALLNGLHARDTLLSVLKEQPVITILAEQEDG